MTLSVTRVRGVEIGTSHLIHALSCRRSLLWSLMLCAPLTAISTQNHDKPTCRASAVMSRSSTSMPRASGSSATATSSSAWTEVWVRIKGISHSWFYSPNALRSAATHQTKCGRTGDVRQHGDRLPHTALRCQQQRSGNYQRLRNHE
jgi:hypothetical protein